MINTEDFSDFLIYQPEMEITTIEKNRYTIEHKQGDGSPV